MGNPPEGRANRDNPPNAVRGKFFSAPILAFGANIGLHGNVFMIDGMGLPKEFRDRHPGFSTRLVSFGARLYRVHLYLNKPSPVGEGGSRLSADG